MYIVLALVGVIGFSFINFNAAAGTGGKKAYTLHMMPDKGLHTAHGAACLDGSDAGFYFRRGGSGDTNWMIYFEGTVYRFFLHHLHLRLRHDCLQRHFLLYVPRVRPLPVYVRCFVIGSAIIS